MGLETMRRWPVFVVFAFCLLLCVSLFSSWTSETDLQVKLVGLQLQLQECSRQQTSCAAESVVLVERRDGLTSKLARLDEDRERLRASAASAEQRALAKDSQLNRTLVDVDLCKTELQSLKNLQVSKSATLETLRLEKETLTTELAERRRRIEELEKEVGRMRTALDSKTAPNAPAPSKVTPVPSPSKQSPEGVLGAPNDPPVIENNAKEDIEDLNTVNDNNFNDFDANEK